MQAFCAAQREGVFHQAGHSEQRGCWRTELCSRTNILELQLHYHILFFGTLGGLTVRQPICVRACMNKPIDWMILRSHLFCELGVCLFGACTWAMPHFDVETWGSWKWQWGSVCLWDTCWICAKSVPTATDCSAGVCLGPHPVAWESLFSAVSVTTLWQLMNEWMACINK